MPNYILAKINKWTLKPSPNEKNRGNGWLHDMTTVFVDKDKNYCVMIREFNCEWGNVEHACIRNKENTDISWAEKQRIKNEIFGKEAVAIEIFPKESELVDEANMYHLWVLNDKNIKIPFTLKF